MSSSQGWVLGAFLGAAVASAAWGWLWLAVEQRKEPATAEEEDALQPRHHDMPHAGWMPGQKQPSPWAPDDKWLQLDPAKMPKVDLYPLVISAFVPRPIALVSSISKGGVVNVAPYSYFNAMGHNPVTLCIGANRSPGRGGERKDTQANIEETGEFVVNIMSDWFLEAANHTCGDYDAEVDELALSGLTPLPSMLVKPPRVGESAVQMECKLRQVVEINDNAGKPSIGIIIAEVVMFHVHEGVEARTPTGKLVVDPVKLRAVSRLGGTLYAATTHIMDVGRPTKAQASLGPAQYTASYAQRAASASTKTAAIVSTSGWLGQGAAATCKLA